MITLGFEIGAPRKAGWRSEKREGIYIYIMMYAFLVLRVLQLVCVCVCVCV